MKRPRALTRRMGGPSNTVRNPGSNYDGGFYQYRLTPSPVPQNGALQFVFQQRWEWPIQWLYGAGKPAGMFNIYAGKQLRVEMALPQATLQAAGVIAGGIDLERLWTMTQQQQVQVGNAD